MAEGDVDGGAVYPAGRSEGPAQAAFQAAIRRATASIKGLTLLLGTVSALVGAYYAFRTALKLEWPYSEAITAVLCALFFSLLFVPEYREQRRLARLRNTGIEGQVVYPAYFRLSAYETQPSERFHRADGCAEEVCRWLRASPWPVSYLSGQSGVGKSSLINAAVVPSLTGGGFGERWAAVTVRPHDEPLRQIEAGLRHGGAVWAKPPADTMEPRRLIEMAAERLKRDGRSLLLVIDQFEEALILCGEAQKAALSALLCDLQARPVPRVKVLILRTGPST